MQRYACSFPEALDALAAQLGPPTAHDIRRALRTLGRAGRRWICLRRWKPGAPARCSRRPKTASSWPAQAPESGAGDPRLDDDTSRQRIFHSIAYALGHDGTALPVTSVGMRSDVCLGASFPAATSASTGVKTTRLLLSPPTGGRRAWTGGRRAGWTSPWSAMAGRGALTGGIGASRLTRPRG